MTINTFLIIFVVTSIPFAVGYLFYKILTAPDMEQMKSLSQNNSSDIQNIKNQHNQLLTKNNQIEEDLNSFKADIKQSHNSTGQSIEKISQQIQSYSFDIEASSKQLLEMKNHLEKLRSEINQPSELPDDLKDSHEQVLKLESELQKQNLEIEKIKTQKTNHEDLNLFRETIEKSFSEKIDQIQNQYHAIVESKKPEPNSVVVTQNVLELLSIRDLNIGSARDNLKKIKGIGPVFEKKLNAIGIVCFKQLATLTEQDIEILSNHIVPFPGRMRRDNWIGQAKSLIPT